MNNNWVTFFGVVAVFACSFADGASAAANLRPRGLRCEYLENPAGLGEPRPRLSWRVEADERGQRQTACRILVASTAQGLAAEQGDLWDSGRLGTSETINLVYQGKPLGSRQACFWKVQAWDQDGQASAWSTNAQFSLGLLQPADWKARWISFRDQRPLHRSRDQLYLPPARYYRKEFTAGKSIERATLYASALGLGEFHLNGRRVDDHYFEPGWSDYLQRVYYRAHDVTALVRPGANALGAIVADGWYSGYVGYGLLVGYGPNRTGRNIYGKTPALLAQLEIVYADGSQEMIVTDPSWRQTGEGPIREADLIMGEFYDARLEPSGWAQAGFAEDRWDKAVAAGDNGSVKTTFSDAAGDREVELGFQEPPRLQAYSGPPVRVTGELPARRLTEPRPGVYIFDLGQNFAGLIRLKIKGPAGKKVQIRYGEMLHPDGRLMTENLRRARATDYYVLKGDPAGETWSPRFTYHGFQFVELEGLEARPGLDAVTGLVLQSDTPPVSAFECSDEVINRLFKNILWTQRANYLELPTDCPQRDERMGWMGDAQIYARAATCNADVAAFFTKWLDDVEEAQRDFGAYPDYCPYPMAHGTPRKTFGTAWMDAGIICPWTIWQVYGDTRVIERHWASMSRFMNFRAAATTPEGLGVSIGNPWGDWLNLNENTPIPYIDTCYHALTSRQMAEMAEAIGRKTEAANYRKRFEDLKGAYRKAYVQADGTLAVDSQTAYVLALDMGLLPDTLVQPAADELARKIADNGFRMATGFLGTKPLLKALSDHGHHDLALRLFQSRQFPSWGYEVVNGATSIWERWDSYTKEDGFGRHNAAMNSFSHYSFGAVCEWMFRCLVGLDTDSPGFQHLVIRPGPPGAGEVSGVTPIGWVKAEYRSPRGTIRVNWKRAGNQFDLEVTLPANTSATIHMPAATARDITENGQPLAGARGVQVLRTQGDRTLLEAGSGHYRFSSKVNP